MSIAGIAGKLSVVAWPEDPIQFTLRNHASEALFLKRIMATPELPDDAIVQDVRVGRNSQVSGVGIFKASILGRLPPLRFDLIPPGRDVTVSFLFAPGGRSYDGRIEFQMGTREFGERHLLCPMDANTLIEGKLIELCVTRRLFKAVEEGRVSVKLKQRPHVPAYQEAPETTHEFGVTSGFLKPNEPVDLPAGSHVTVAFSGERADEFVSADAVGILKLNVTKF